MSLCFELFSSYSFIRYLYVQILRYYDSISGERPYKCHLQDCGRAFIQLSNLQQHLRNHDAQVERAKNRPFHCNICGKGFATESSLRTHTSKVSSKNLIDFIVFKYLVTNWLAGVHFVRIRTQHLFHIRCPSLRLSTTLSSWQVLARNRFLFPFSNSSLVDSATARLYIHIFRQLKLKVHPHCTVYVQHFLLN